MNLAFVTPEAVPFAKTGGLADVSGALPKELSKLGINVRVFMPLYSAIEKEEHKLNYLISVGKIKVTVGEEEIPAEFYLGYLPGSDVEVYFVDCPRFFKRKSFYTTAKDEPLRWIFFNKAVLELIQRLKWQPDIIHCHDWQTGLLPYYIKYNYSWDILFRFTKSVYTIHNIGYQGLFPQDVFKIAEVADEFVYPTGPAEYYHKFSFLKMALVFSDEITTVSPTYAKELLTEEYGGGMHGVLSSRKGHINGILNGVDYSIWNPETDEFIPYNYGIKNLGNKKKNKKELLERLHLPFNSSKPLIGMVSRIVSQKGYDILAEAIRDLTYLDIQWIILGSGDKKYERLIKKLENKYPNHLSAHIGYHNGLAHLIEAGSDMFLMPSLYEPCGLNQIYSLKYGTIPIVRKTGGLNDTVKDWNLSVTNNEFDGTGFVFEDYTGKALFEAVKRASEVFKDRKTWKKIQINGMKKDFSWEKSAIEYKQLFESL